MLQHLWRVPQWTVSITIQLHSGSPAFSSMQVRHLGGEGRTGDRERNWEEGGHSNKGTARDNRVDNWSHHTTHARQARPFSSENGRPAIAIGACFIIHASGVSVSLFYLPASRFLSSSLPTYYIHYIATTTHHRPYYPSAAVPYAYSFRSDKVAGESTSPHLHPHLPIDGFEDLPLRTRA